jgi:hypothetical protein
MNVLIDLHHDELHESLIKLFEDRLKFKVYTPIGTDWQHKGFWGISAHQATIDQFLFINSENKDVWKEIETGVFYKKECSRYRKYFNYITLDCAIEKKWDIIVATHPHQFEYYYKFSQKYCPTAKLITQFGNMMPYLPKNCKNVLNSTSSDYYLPDLKSINLVNYSQEFDYTDIFEYSLPEKIESLNTFLLYNSCNNENLMNNITNRLQWQSCQYGVGNKDGHISNYKELVNKIKNSGFVWHYKKSGDGYGHTLYKSLFAGRPVLINNRMFQFHRLTHLKFFEDGLTYINCNVDKNDADLSCDSIVKKILSFRENYENNSKQIFERIRNLVDFDKEEIEIRKFIENLR